MKITRSSPGFTLTSHVESALTRGLGPRTGLPCKSVAPARRQRTMIIAASVVVAADVVVILVAFFMQRPLVFLPDASQVGSAADVLDGGQDLTLHTDDGVKLSAWLFPPDASADREQAVLYALGSAVNRQARVGIADHVAVQ